MENGTLDLDAGRRRASELWHEERMRVALEKDLRRIRDDIDRTCRIVQALVAGQARAGCVFEEVERLLRLRQRELDLVSGAATPDPTWQPQP